MISRRWGASKAALVFINLLFFVLLFRWLAQNIQGEKLLESLRSIPVWALASALAINLTALCFYGLRMKLLLRRDFFSSLSVVNIGYALNSLIPLRLGEVMKIYIANRLLSIPVSNLVLASVVEKLFDLFKLLLLGAGLALFAASQLVRSGLLLSILGALIVAVAMFIFLRTRIVLIVRLLPKGTRLRRLLISVHRHVGEYPLSKIALVSAVIWSLNVALMYFTFNTFLGNSRVSVSDAVALLLIISFAIATPSAPGGLGLFEAGIVAYLTQKLHIQSEVALASAIMFHFIITVPQTILTAVLFIKARPPHGKY